MITLLHHWCKTHKLRNADRDWAKLLGCPVSEDPFLKERGLAAMQVAQLDVAINQNQEYTAHFAQIRAENGLSDYLSAQSKLIYYAKSSLNYAAIELLPRWQH